MGDMTVSKKGQLTLSFNWIFVMVAGAVILLFFVGLIVKQKDSSEQKLNFDVVNILESILVGSTVSEQTINTIDTSGISSMELFFECELDSDGGFLDVFARYGITGTTASQELPIQVIMSPPKFSTKKLILWSLPYEMPFKVTDILILTGQSHQYYVFGSSSSVLGSELQNATSSFNIDFVTSASEISSIGANEHVRIIDLDGSYIAAGAPVPIELNSASDQDVSAVVLGIGGYDLYQKEGNVFAKVNRAGQIPIISLFNSDRDAAQISALFSGSQENYQCNMMKVFKRMEIIVDVYEGKAMQLANFYESPENYDSECLLLYDDVAGELNPLGVQITSCVARGYEDCLNIEEYSRRLLELNDELDNAGCIELY